MEGPDLKLVAIEDLINEVFARTQDCVIAFTRSEDGGAPNIRAYHRGESYLRALGLCSELERTIQDDRDKEAPEAG